MHLKKNIPQDQHNELVGLDQALGLVFQTQSFDTKEVATGNVLGVSTSLLKCNLFDLEISNWEGYEAGNLCQGIEKGILQPDEDGIYRISKKYIDLVEFVSIVERTVLKDDKEFVQGQNAFEYLNSKNYFPDTIKCVSKHLTYAEVVDMLERIESKDVTKPAAKLNINDSCAEEFVHPLQDPACAGYARARGYTSYHTGVDLVKRDGCWINSVGSGVVEKAENCRSMGFCVVIRHDNAKKYRSLYMHGNGEFAVKVGDRVQAGQRIMYMGNTGNSIAVHLHLSMSENDQDVIRYGNRKNPETLLGINF